MYSPLDSGQTAYSENTVEDGRKLLYVDGISETWHDVQSKDRQNDRRDIEGVGCLEHFLHFIFFPYQPP